MVAKHIRSAILSELLLRSRAPGEAGEKVRKIVKELFPVFIRTYLLDEESHYRQTPTDTAPLADLLGELKDSLANRLGDKVWGAYPSMVNLKDGSVLIVYYEDGHSRSSVRARRFRATRGGIEWLVP